tara:strand:- start:681 stop:929 length:249 start_codon:yes stop_codon:yes gene_type:complete
MLYAIVVKQVEQNPDDPEIYVSGDYETLGEASTRRSDLEPLLEWSQKQKPDRRPGYDVSYRIIELGYDWFDLFQKEINKDRA